jgi:hypothetical protein
MALCLAGSIRWIRRGFATEGLPKSSTTPQGKGLIVNNDTDLANGDGDEAQSPTFKHVLCVVLGACLAAGLADTFIAADGPAFVLSPKGVVFWLLSFILSALVIFGGIYVAIAFPVWAVWRWLMRKPRSSAPRALLFALIPAAIVWVAIIVVSA